MLPSFKFTVAVTAATLIVGMAYAPRSHSEPLTSSDYEAIALQEQLSSERPVAPEETPLLRNCNPSSLVDSALLRGLYMQYHRLLVKTGDDSRQTKKALESFQCAREIYRNRYAGDISGKQSASWMTEELKDPSGPSITLTDSMDRILSWAKGTTPTRFTDRALNFAPTSNNKLELFYGHDPYHEALFKDLNAAKNSIHMHMYGVLADDYGWTVAKTLAAKAREGLKVRFITDKFGARLTWLNKVPKDGEAGPIQPMLDFMKDAGVDVVVSYDRGNNGLFNYDHRKFYIIDGQIGWNVGYTVENNMRHKYFDQGTRIHGDLTRQLQATFFANWLAEGGTVPEAADTAGFLGRYFPDPEETGSAQVALLDNIPHAQQMISESYYKHISEAKKQVIVTNLFFADIRFAKALMQAKKNGADVTIIMQAHKSAPYTQFAEFYFRKFLKLGIKAYWFHGQEGYDLAHAKIVLADNYVSTGSCNFDAFSLFHNGEQNIETEDAEYVDSVRSKLFPEMLKYSTLYQREGGLFHNIGVTFRGWLAKSYELVF